MRAELYAGRLQAVDRKPEMDHGLCPWRLFSCACRDAGIEGLVWHDLRATYGTRLGEAGFNAYDVAKLMGNPNISTSQRYVRNISLGSAEAVLLKTQRRHKTVK